MDLQAVDTALQACVDRGELAGVSYSILRGGQVVAQNCIGWADREAGLALREDHLFRVFSNTKLVTSCAALQLLEQGRFGLDDPVGDYIPALRHLRVLRPGATTLDDAQPAREPVRIRHLLTHTAGFTYAFLQPDAPIARAYVAAGIADPALSLAQMVDALGSLPLLFEPGSRWHYSVATDVVGRLVEVTSGQALDHYFQRHVFDPLGMEDTYFFVPPEKADRLAALYVGNRQGRGLRRASQEAVAGAFLQPVPRLNAGGGLVSSLGDYSRFVGVLQQGGAPLLKSATLPLVTANQLPAGMWIGFPGAPLEQGRGHSFAASVMDGELQWGGLAGTKWFLAPRENLAAVLMTQRYMGADLTYWTQFKALVRRSAGA